MAAIEMPGYIDSRKFRLSTAQQLTPSGENGFIQTLERSSPFWRAEYTTPGLTGDRYNDMVAFLDQLEGAIGTFLAYDPRRPMPWAYRAQPLASTPWGVPNAVAYNYANSTVTLSGVTNGAILTKGDYISFQQGIIWYLFRLQASYISTGANIVASVKPRPNLTGVLNSVVRYKKACCEMKMLGLYDENDSVSEVGPSFSFSGTQYIARAPA